MARKITYGGVIKMQSGNGTSQGVGKSKTIDKVPAANTGSGQSGAQQTMSGSTKYTKPNGQQGTAYFSQPSSPKPGNNAWQSGVDDYGETDYSVLLSRAMSAGASADEVSALLGKRTDKALSGGAAYQKYAYDDTYRAAQEYIKNQQQEAIQNTYSDLIREQQRAQAEAQRQAEAAKRAAVEQSVGRLEAQKAGLADNYGDLYRQLYIDKRMAERNMPQQMAAMGYTGGLTESALLGVHNQYTDALRQGESARLAQERELDQAITDARLAGDISIAEQAAEIARDGFQTYAELAKERLSQNNWERQFAHNQQQDALAQSNADREFALSQMLHLLEREDVDYSRKVEAAQYLYKATGRADYLRVLGYDDADIAALENLWVMQQAGSNRGKSSESGGGTAYEASVPTGSSLTYQDAMREFNDGNYTADGIHALLENGHSRQELAGYGYTPATAVVVEGGHSEGYWALLQELSRLEDGGATVSQIPQRLLQALDAGRITNQEYEQLKANYGG